MTKIAEINPCPLCGGAPNIASHSGDERVGYVTTWVLTCIKCGARESATDTTDENGWSNAKPEETKLRAIAAWNNRTPDPTFTAAIREAAIEAAATQISEGIGAILRKFCESTSAAKARQYLHTMPDDEWRTLTMMLAEASADAILALIPTKGYADDRD